MSVGRTVLLVFALATGACTDDPLPGSIHELPQGDPYARRAPPVFTNTLPVAAGLPNAVDFDDLPERHDLLPPDPVLPRLWNTVRGARFDMTAGEALQERLDEIPDSAEQGIAVLTLSEMWGTEENQYEDGLCEPLRVTWDFEDDEGEEWDAVIQISQFNAIIQAPAYFPATLSNTCRAALDGSTDPADAVASGDCIETDEQSFFREGTDCRACLEEGSTIDACQADGTCPEAPPLTWFWNGVDGSRVLIETSYSYILSCAPNQGSLWYMVSTIDEDPELPGAFDNEGWIGYCLAYTDETTGEIQTGCVGETLEPGVEGHTLGEGVPTRIERISHGGRDTPGWWDRPGFLQSLEIQGFTTDWFWGGPSPGIGGLSGKVETGGWGLPPTQLRPDGSDPEDPDDTFARDWVAAYTLKTSTARNGVIVSFDNRSRCGDDAWEGPDERGRYRCTSMEAPDPAWSEDGGTYAVDGGFVFANPIRTLASTGLPDPQVPGGVAVHLACSPLYEQIEGWSCPHTFEPDIVMYDDIPDVYAATSALEGQGYRFGKDPEWDIRMTMGSTWRRMHRPFDEFGGEP